MNTENNGNNEFVNAVKLVQNRIFEALKIHNEVIYNHSITRNGKPTIFPILQMARTMMADDLINGTESKYEEFVTSLDEEVKQVVVRQVERDTEYFQNQKFETMYLPIALAKSTWINNLRVMAYKHKKMRFLVSDEQLKTFDEENLIVEGQNVSDVYESIKEFVKTLPALDSSTKADLLLSTTLYPSTEQNLYREFLMQDYAKSAEFDKLSKVIGSVEDILAEGPEVSDGFQNLVESRNQAVFNLISSITKPFSTPVIDFSLTEGDENVSSSSVGALDH